MIPNVAQAAVDQNGHFTVPWRKWFAEIERRLASNGASGSDIAAQVAAIATALGSPDGTVENIPPQDWLAPFTLTAAPGSGITITGTPAGGSVVISATGGGISDGDKGDIVVSGSGSVWALESNLKKGAIRCVFDGLKNSSGVRQVVQAGTTVYGLSVPYSGTITGARIVADQTGSLVLAVWKDTYASYPPTSSDSIVASAPPTLSSAASSYDTTLTGWNKAVSAGDVFRVSVTSASAITWAELTLEITKT